MTPIEEIREAVRVLRVGANDATPGPWRAVIDDNEDLCTIARTCTSPDHPADDPDQTWVYDCCRDTPLHGDPGFHHAGDALYAATMDPRVALELANLLEVTLRTLEVGGEAFANAAWVNQDYAPLRVARAVLKRGAS